MRLLTEEELKKAYMGSDYHPTSKIVLGIKHGVERVADAEHKETLKAVIKDLEMIMKEAPDLKSLEKMIAGYITEKRGEMPEEASTSG